MWEEGEEGGNKDLDVVGQKKNIACNRKPSREREHEQNDTHFPVNLHITLHTYTCLDTCVLSVLVSGSPNLSPWNI